MEALEEAKRSKKVVDAKKFARKLLGEEAEFYKAKLAQTLDDLESLERRDEAVKEVKRVAEQVKIGLEKAKFFRERIGLVEFEQRKGEAKKRICLLNSKH